jgi:ribosomal protein L40E
MKYKMMQCMQCGSYLSAMACQFGCTKCGYKDG